jgi:hypothetical protein
MKRIHILAIALVMMCGCDKGKTDSPVAVGAQKQLQMEQVDRTPIAVVHAISLFQEYDQNPIAADAKYKDKYITLRLNAERIFQDSQGRNCVGQPAIIAGSLSEFEFASLPARERRWFTNGYPANIVCVIADESLQDAAKIQQQNQGTLIGKVAGRRAAEAYREFVVELVDCTSLQFVPPPPQEPLPASFYPGQNDKPKEKKAEQPAKAEPKMKTVELQLQAGKTAKVKSRNGEAFARVFKTREMHDRWIKAESAGDLKEQYAVAGDSSDPIFIVKAQETVSILEVRDYSCHIKAADGQTGWLLAQQLDAGTKQVPE